MLQCHYLVLHNGWKLTPIELSESLCVLHFILQNNISLWLASFLHGIFLKFKLTYNGVTVPQYFAISELILSES